MTAHLALTPLYGFRIANKSDPSSADGLFFLVDLAGSEADLDSKEHSRELMKETRDINLSLSTLKDCIRGRALWDLNDGAGKGNGKGLCAVPQTRS